MAPASHPRALAAVRACALDEAGFYRLHLSHATRNYASCRVALEAGFPPEARYDASCRVGLRAGFPFEGIERREVPRRRPP